MSRSNERRLVPLGLPSFEKVLTPNNITKGFRKTGIYPLNEHAVDDKMGLAAQFQTRQPLEESSSENDDGEELEDAAAIEEVLGNQAPESQEALFNTSFPLREKSAKHGRAERAHMTWTLAIQGKRNRWHLWLGCWSCRQLARPIDDIEVESLWLTI
jgi:hypothetical protein